VKATAAELIKRLEQDADSDSFINTAHEVVGIAEESENAFFFVEPIIEFMENHPQTDFGAPGPLTHFVERFYRKGYEEILVGSLKRRPTELTVWMLNRIINDAGNPSRESYLELMRQTACREDIDSAAREAAVYYLEWQKQSRNME